MVDSAISATSELFCFLQEYLALMHEFLLLTNIVNCKESSGLSNLI